MTHARSQIGAAAISSEAQAERGIVRSPDLTVVAPALNEEANITLLVGHTDPSLVGCRARGRCDFGII